MRLNQGAPRRAFFSPHLRVALLLSLGLHALLLAVHWQRVRHIPIPQHGGELEVRLEFLPSPVKVGVEVEATHPEKSVRLVLRTESADTSPALKPAQESPAPPQPAIEQNTGPARAVPPVLGIAIPQQLPIPFPGKQPMWSFQPPVMADVQAAYQAQKQYQALLEMQARNQAAMAQYEFHLRQTLSGLRLQAGCTLHYGADEAWQWQCQQPVDGEALREVLNNLGQPPRPHDVQGWWFELKPDPAGGPTQILRRERGAEPIGPP